MFDPLRHLVNFVQTTWEMLRSALGTSSLSILVFTVCVPFFIFVVSVGRNWYGQRPLKLETLLTAFRNWIKPTRLAIGVTTLAWVVLFSWAVIKTAYNDHQNLSGRLRNVVNEKNDLKVSLANRDVAMAKLMKKRESRLDQLPVPSRTPVLRYGISLRDRANKLANELQAFDDERDKHYPSTYVNRDMTPEQQRAATAPRFNYQQETYKLYTERFSIRVVTIVQEFKGLGIDVSQIENCAVAGVCPAMPIPIQLHAFAARLDDNGNVRRPN
jgi:hypothetical protein